MKRYILKNKKPILCDDIDEWCKLYKHEHVAKTSKGGVMVSTVFLGLDHNWGTGPPLVFETMIFGGQYDEEMWRYSIWEEAEEGHKKACQLVGLNLIYIVQKILNIK